MPAPSQAPTMAASLEKSVTNMVTNSILHYTIIKYIIDNGFAPNVDTLSEILKTGGKDIEKGLYALQEYYGVVLHPKEAKVWAIHPFSLAPTNFLLKSKKGVWWGNCAGVL
jgi:hypothetical protein